MIEAKREGCFGYWHERTLLGFPMGHYLPTTHAEEQGLLRQWNWRRNRQTEHAIVCNRRDRAARLARGKAALPGKINEAIITFCQIDELELIGIANDRDKHTILSLHRKSDVNGAWMDDSIADEPAGWRAIL